MPPHTSHILQLLDVGCFAPLKRAFRATSLVLDNPEVVLSRLKVKPRTLTLPLPRKAQTTLILKRIRDYRSSLPKSILKIVLQVKKGLTLKVHSHTLLEA
ncbi:uncharacterized protein M421DRAFT_423709 [Didymella exigua CBS 183.55]|uniref:DDE-1 domain-containing protein n=1 Tax=Didymella exigua CBS 183.55 TaxID=1150837 RepID=A0A6A5RDI9_9PLEO|nr:uncharacterized protein M421DRAFT_423709 [Didymella exigua CBS 183.55]KAF1925380.1 hypothetical protein M421DRAFT_423709 [Didymella exigua CBS 183.55]